MIHPRKNKDMKHKYKLQFMITFEENTVSLSGFLL